MGPVSSSLRAPVAWPNAVLLPLRQLAQSGGRRLAGLSNESRWAVGGLLLAQLMVVVLYLMLVDNVTQVESKRAAAAAQARERHSCALMQVRLEREQCFAALSTSQPVEGIATSFAQR